MPAGRGFNSARKKDRGCGKGSLLSTDGPRRRCGISILFLSPTAFLVEFAKRGPEFKGTLSSALPTPFIRSDISLGWKRDRRASKTERKFRRIEKFVVTIFICFLGRRTCWDKNINLQLLEIWLSSWLAQRKNYESEQILLLISFLQIWNNSEEILLAQFVILCFNFRLYQYAEKILI